MTFAPNHADLINNWDDVMSEADWNLTQPFVSPLPLVALAKAIVERDLVGEDDDTIAIFAQGNSSNLRQVPYSFNERAIEGRLYQDNNNTYVSDTTHAPLTGNSSSMLDRDGARFYLTDQQFKFTVAPVEITEGVFENEFENIRINTFTGVILVDFVTQSQVDQDVSHWVDLSSDLFSIYYNYLPSAGNNYNPPYSLITCDVGSIEEVEVDIVGLSTNPVALGTYTITHRHNYTLSCLPGFHVNSGLYNTFSNTVESLSETFLYQDVDLSMNNDSAYGSAPAQVAERFRNLYLALVNMKYIEPPKRWVYTGGFDGWSMTDYTENLQRAIDGDPLIPNGTSIYGDFEFSCNYNLKLSHSFSLGRVDVLLTRVELTPDGVATTPYFTCKVSEAGIEQYYWVLDEATDLPLTISRTANLLTLTLGGNTTHPFLTTAEVSISRFLDNISTQWESSGFTPVKGENFRSRYIQGEKEIDIAYSHSAAQWGIQRADELDDEKDLPIYIRTPVLPYDSIVTITSVITAGTFTNGEGDARKDVTKLTEHVSVTAGESFSRLVTPKSTSEMWAEGYYIWREVQIIEAIEPAYSFPAALTAQTFQTAVFLSTDTEPGSAFATIPKYFPYNRSLYRTTNSTNSRISLDQLTGVGVFSGYAIGRQRVPYQGSTIVVNTVPYGSDMKHIQEDDTSLTLQLCRYQYNVVNTDTGLDHNREIKYEIFRGSYYKDIDLRLHGETAHTHSYSNFLSYVEVDLWDHEISDVNSAQRDKTNQWVIYDTTENFSADAPLYPGDVSAEVAANNFTEANMYLSNSSDEVEDLPNNQTGADKYYVRFAWVYEVPFVFDGLVQGVTISDMYGNIYYAELTGDFGAINLGSAGDHTDMSTLYNHDYAPNVATADISWDGTAYASSRSFGITIYGGAGSLLTVGGNLTRDDGPENDHPWGGVDPYDTYYYRAEAFGLVDRDAGTAFGRDPHDEFSSGDAAQYIYRKLEDHSYYYYCRYSFGTGFQIYQSCTSYVVDYPSLYTSLVSYVTFSRHTVIYQYSDLVQGGIAGGYGGLYRRTKTKSYGFSFGNNRGPDYTTTLWGSPVDVNQKLFPSSYTQDGLAFVNSPQGSISTSVSGLSAPPAGLFGSLHWPEKASQWNVTGATIDNSQVDIQQENLNDLIGHLSFTPTGHSKNNVNNFPIDTLDERLIMHHDQGIAGSGSNEDIGLGTLLYNRGDSNSDSTTSPVFKVLNKTSNIYPDGWIETEVPLSITRTLQPDFIEPDALPDLQLWWNYLEVYAGPSLDPIPPLELTKTVFGQSLGANTVLVLPDEDPDINKVKIADPEVDGIEFTGNSASSSAYTYASPLIGEGDPSAILNDPIYIESIIWHDDDWSWEIRFWDAIEQTSGVFVRANKYIVVFSATRTQFPII